MGKHVSPKDLTIYDSRRIRARVNLDHNKLKVPSTGVNLRPIYLKLDDSIVSIFMTMIDSQKRNPLWNLVQFKRKKNVSTQTSTTAAENMTRMVELPLQNLTIQDEPNMEKE